MISAADSYLSADKRLAGRRKLYYNLVVKNPIKNENIGFVADISDHGLMFLSESKWFPKNKEYVIALDLSQKQEIQEDLIDLGVTIRWVKRDLNPHLFRIGCEINNLSKNTKKILDKVVKLM